MKPTINVAHLKSYDDALFFIDDRLRSRSPEKHFFILSEESTHSDIKEFLIANHHDLHDILIEADCRNLCPSRFSFLIVQSKVDNRTLQKIRTLPKDKFYVLLISNDENSNQFANENYILGTPLTAIAMDCYDDPPF